MKLIKPNISHTQKYLDLIAKWSVQEDISKTSPGALFTWENFEDFLEINKNRPLWIWVKVPAQLYFAVENDEIVWAIDIRFHIDHPVLKYHGWHIWYGVAPEYRRKWYATKMLWLALQECKNIGLEKVLLTCDTDNIASAKTIEKNGWILQDIILWEWVKNSRYWISI